MKRERLDAHLADRDLAAVWFARPNSFAWLTGGSNVVDREAEVGVAAAGYDGDEVIVVTNNIEAERLHDEELDDDVTVKTYDWHAGTLADAVSAVSKTPAAADFDVGDFETVDASEFRQPLTPADVESCRRLARETASAVEAVCHELESEDSEREVVAAIRVALGARGIGLPVALVGGSERAQRYRHYTPTESSLGDYALVSVTACRDGLHVSCTRTVAFDAPDWLDERHQAAMRVEAETIAATQRVGTEGGTAADVFGVVQDAYDAAGFPDEWRHHHQGGAAGYAGREWIATPDLTAPVTLPMAYAWNPTVQGAKSEDTVLVSEDEVDVLTETGNWPTRTVQASGGDLKLERHDVLRP